MGDAGDFGRAIARFVAACEGWSVAFHFGLGLKRRCTAVRYIACCLNQNLGIQATADHVSSGHGFVMSESLFIATG
jgi:hypothetical protein